MNSLSAIDEGKRILKKLLLNKAGVKIPTKIPKKMPAKAGEAKGIPGAGGEPASKPGGMGIKDVASQLSEAVSDIQKAKELGAQAKQEKTEEKSMEEGEKPLEQQIKEMKQEIDRVEQQIEHAPPEYDTTPLKNQKAQLEQSLKKLEEAKKQRDAEIAAKKAQIAKAEAARSAYQRDEKLDAGIDAAAAIPGADVVGIPLSIMEGVRHAFRDKKMEQANQQLGTKIVSESQKSQQLQSQAQQIKQSAGTPGSVQAIPKTESSGSSGGSGGLGGSGGASSKPATTKITTGGSGISGGSGSSGISSAGGTGGSGKPNKINFAAGIAGLEDEKKGFLSSGMGKIAIALFLIVGLIGVPGTAIGSPAAWVAGKVASISAQGAKGTAAEGAHESQSFIQKAVRGFQTQYKKSIQQATGQRVEGKVENEKRFVGIEIKDSYLPNPKKITQNEPLEISARVHGFSPKRPMKAKVVCHMQPRELSFKKLAGSDKVGGDVNFYAGEPQTVSPTSLSGDNFDEEITCYPDVYTCGDMAVTITVEADDLTTDSVLNNYIIDNTYLEEELKEYAKSKDIELGSLSAVQSAMKELHPEIEDYRSISDKGPIALFMITEQSSLIGIDTTGKSQKKLKLSVALENELDGWLRSVNEMTIIIPKNLRPVPELCRKWKISGNKMTLGKDYWKELSFKDLGRGLQKVMPSCQFEYSGSPEDIIGTAQRITFLGHVSYNYIVQKENIVDILTPDGKKCPKVKAKTVTVKGSTSSLTTKLGVKKEEAASSDDVLKAIHEQLQKQLGKPGTNLEETTFFGQKIKINKKAKPKLEEAESNIQQNCKEGADYFEKKPPIKGYQNMPDPDFPQYPSLAAYGIQIEINPAKNPGGQTGTEVKTDIPTCVVSAFKSAGWSWGAENTPKNPAIFLCDSILTPAK